MGQVISFSRENCILYRTRHFQDRRFGELLMLYQQLGATTREEAKLIDMVLPPNRRKMIYHNRETATLGVKNPL